MVKVDYDELEKIKEKIDRKRERSADLARAINGLQQEKTPDGDIELMIKKSQQVFSIVADDIVSFLQRKKDNVDADIEALLAKITIKP